MNNSNALAEIQSKYPNCNLLLPSATSVQINPFYKCSVMEVVADTAPNSGDETVDLQENISEELTIGFDARLVIETLKAFDCDNVGISLQSPKMPMIIEAEDSDFKTIVLPVAIK